MVKGDPPGWTRLWTRRGGATRRPVPIPVAAAPWCLAHSVEGLERRSTKVHSPKYLRRVVSLFEHLPDLGSLVVTFGSTRD